MNNTFPYWQFDDGKWLTGKISSFDLDGQGLFLQFCMSAWESHGVFNICSTSLSMRFKKEVEWINKTVQAMVDVKILVKNGDQYRIKFIDDQLAELMDIRQKRSMAGKASAQARIADVPPTPPSNKPPENKEEKSKEEKRRVLKSVQQVLNKCSTSVEFSTFWQAYPRKDGKAKAFESWEKHGCSAILPKILATIEKYKKSEQWTKDGGKFIPMPSTWLNQGRWEDEPTAVESDHSDPVKKPESMWEKTKRLEMLDQRWNAITNYDTPEANQLRALRKQLRKEISEGKQ